MTPCDFSIIITFIDITTSTFHLITSLKDSEKNDILAFLLIITQSKFKINYLMFKYYHSNEKINNNQQYHLIQKTRAPVFFLNNAYR